jgi:hypothetical protein
VEDLSKISKDLDGYFELMNNPKLKKKNNIRKFIKQYPKKWQKIKQKNNKESK